jgi:hypothetical protein
MAGSQVPFCPLEKKMFDSWSIIEPGSFRVRSKTYFRDKKKELAPNYAAYNPFGVDVFLSQRKVNHIAQYVELPVVTTTPTKLPSILVVNVQVYCLVPWLNCSSFASSLVFRFNDDVAIGIIDSIVSSCNFSW